MKQIKESKTKEAIQENETPLFVGLANHIPDEIFVAGPQTRRLLGVNQSAVTVWDKPVRDY